MKKIGLAISLIMIFSAPVFAEGPGWLTPSKIKRIVVVYSGGVNVKLENGPENCTSLSGYGKKYLSLYKDHPGVDRIYSLLLAAYASQKEVHIYLTDDTCKIGEVVIGGSYSS